MFGLIADLLSSLLTLLLPIYASHRALRSPSPASTTPWLMYWVVLGLLLFLESWTEWFLLWLPFYRWVRLSVHLWLVLPQTQGAKQIYTQHVEPFLARHEAEIEHTISTAHDRAKALGWASLRSVIDAIRIHVLGLPPTEQQKAPKPSSGAASYAQGLLARFNIPAAATDAPGDVYGLLAAALGHMTSTGSSTSGSKEAQAASLSASGVLIPPGMKRREDKMEYIAAQREKLGVLMRALDQEAVSLGANRGPGLEIGEELGRSRSEVSFDRVEKDEADSDDGTVTPSAKKRTASGGWMPWVWASGDKAASSSVDVPK